MFCLCFLAIRMQLTGSAKVHMDEYSVDDQERMTTPSNHSKDPLFNRIRGKSYQIFHKLTLYSGKCLPACLKSQTGVFSTFSPLATRSMRSFLSVCITTGDPTREAEFLETGLAADKGWQGRKGPCMGVKPNPKAILAVAATTTARRSTMFTAAGCFFSFPPRVVKQLNSKKKVWGGQSIEAGNGKEAMDASSYASWCERWRQKCTFG
jgi:hypothetical protein